MGQLLARFVKGRTFLCVGVVGSTHSEPLSCHNIAHVLSWQLPTVLESETKRIKNTSADTNIHGPIISEKDWLVIHYFKDPMHGCKIANFILIWAQLEDYYLNLNRIWFQD